MKVSVIVPVYKVEQYLPKCVDSLVGQTLQELEIILVNDGSPDNSQQIIDEYKLRYPEKIRSLIIDNGGQGRARNFGIDIAEGEYIGFVDSDDWVDPEMFETLYNAAVAADADVSICDAMGMYPDGKEEYMSARYEAKRPLRAAGSCFDKLYRRSLLEGIRFPVGLWYEDLSFSAKALLSAKSVAYTQKPLYRYRIGHPSTMRNNNSKRNLEIISILEDIRAFLGEGRNAEDFQELVINHVLLDSVNRVSLHKSENRDEVIAELRSYVKKYVPSLSGCRPFCDQPRKRRIIMRLNYLGLHDLSKLVLAAKKKLVNK